VISKASLFAISGSSSERAFQNAALIGQLFGEEKWLNGSQAL
jgi:hypothetical protein